MLTLRNLLFYLVYWLSLPIFSFAGLLLWPLTRYPTRSAFVTLWNRLVVWWLSVCCGVKYEFKGLENLPEQPCVILANHQSAWETLALQYLFSPASTVLKKELLNLPVFGWGLRAMEPIAIDRSNPREALKAVKSQGLKRLEAGYHVLIFPEGTRKKPGELGNFARSGADIACAAGVPVVPVAHNAGIVWPTKQWKKYPGKLTLSIGSSINTKGASSKEITEKVRNWISQELNQMSLK